ncbi:tyrosine-protein kinase [Streptococcus ovis]|uniref:tyrosine-protein kinase n=1 Tax=Streptococcus ovis TaxID=82806 RepID=UPI00036A6366|nr:tyrosine-protein kinase [Streptococcus ovis]
MAQFVLARTKAQMFKTMEEYYNSIRVNIQFSGSSFKVITVTSVQPSEGKSTTSANLALSFAQAGYRTLLIDADIRNSVMTGTFKADNAYHGLTSYLSGHVGLADIISQTSVENLHIVPAGQVSPNPTTLLQNALFSSMIDQVSNIYDFVIIDTPPIGLVVDAAVIAQRSDASLLVTEFGAVSRKFVKKAVEQMQQSGVPFLGVILNKVDTKKDNYGSYGSYGDYGKQKEQAAKHAKKASKK